MPLLLVLVVAVAAAVVLVAASVEAVAVLVGRSIRLMVTTTDTTEIVTQPKLEEYAQPSVKRWLKHFFYMPATKRFSPSRIKMRLH